MRLLVAFPNANSGAVAYFNATQVSSPLAKPSFLFPVPTAAWRSSKWVRDFQTNQVCRCWVWTAGKTAACSW